MKFILQKKDLHIANIVSILAFVIAFWGNYLIISDKLYLGFILILIACLFDLFDGFLSRKYNSLSSLGKYLDSFSDILIYILPLVFIYLSIYSFSITFLFTSFILFFSSIFRLSFFTQTGLSLLDNKKFYLGLPVYYLLILNIIIFFEINFIIINVLFIIFSFLMILDINIRKANFLISILYIFILFVFTYLFLIGIL